MSTQGLMTDDAYIEDSQGKRYNPIKTKFGGNKLIVFDDKLSVCEGAVVIQPLPNGTEVRYAVIDSQFSTGLRSLKPHYSLTVEKESKQQKTEKMASNTTYHINNSNVQVGNGNVQNIVNAFEQLAREIEISDSSPAQREEAKGLLKSIIANPTVASVLGGAVSGLLGAI